MSYKLFTPSTNKQEPESMCQHEGRLVSGGGWTWGCQLC